MHDDACGVVNELALNDAVDFRKSADTLSDLHLIAWNPFKLQAHTAGNRRNYLDHIITIS